MVISTKTMTSYYDSLFRPTDWDEEHMYESMMEKEKREYEEEMMEERLIANKKWFDHCYRNGIPNYVYYMIYDTCYYINRYLKSFRKIKSA